MSDAFFNPIDAACMVLSWWSQTYEPRIASLAPLPPDIGIKHVAELMESLVKIVPIADREVEAGFWTAGVISRTARWCSMTLPPAIWKAAVASWRTSATAATAGPDRPQPA